MLLNWYALHCKSNTEAIIARHLDSTGVESFYPHRVIPAGHAKHQTIEKYFPGYLFARIELEHRLCIAHPAVLRIVTDGVAPAVISDFEIENMQRMLAAPVLVSAHPMVRGDKVMVMWGPLAGTTGVVIHLPKNKLRLVVAVEMMGRGISSEVDAGSVELIEPMRVAA